MNSARAHYPLPQPMCGRIAPWPSSSPSNRRSATAQFYVCVTLVFGVFAMSIAIAKAWTWTPLPERTQLAPRVEYQPPAEADIEQLSTQQKLALLQMSRRISHQTIWRAVKEKYDEAPFDRSAFRQLRERGLAELLDDQKYHSLTTSGAQFCDLIGRQLVRDHKIHVPWIGGNVGASTSLHCTCGWSCGLRLGDNMQLKATRAMSTHLRTVEAMDGLRTALESRGGENG
jgi:hypothetical protein